MTFTAASTLYDLVSYWRPPLPRKFKFPKSCRKCQLERKICPQSTSCPCRRTCPQESQYSARGPAADRARGERSHLSFLSAQGHPVSHLQIKDAGLRAFKYFSLLLLQVGSLTIILGENLALPEPLNTSFSRAGGKSVERVRLSFQDCWVLHIVSTPHQPPRRVSVAVFGTEN